MAGHGLVQKLQEVAARSGKVDKRREKRKPGLPNWNRSAPEGNNRKKEKTVVTWAGAAQLGPNVDGSRSVVAGNTLVPDRASLHLLSLPLYLLQRSRQLVLQVGEAEVQAACVLTGREGAQVVLPAPAGVCV